MEKRESNRLNINIPMKYKLMGNESIYQTIMHDISNGGLRLMSKVSIPSDKKIMFELNLSGNGKPIVSIGKIAWVKAHRFGNGFYEAGIKFNGLKDLERECIYSFIKKNSS